MRKLLLPVVIALVGVTLAFAPPATAKKMHWHTVMKVKGFHIQSCLDHNRHEHYRIDGRHAKRWSSYYEDGYADGQLVSGRSLSAVPPHRITPLPGGDLIRVHQVDHIKVVVEKTKHHKKVVKKKKVRPARFNRC